MLRHVIERIFDMFRTTLVLAALGFFSFTSAASALELKGKMKDLPTEFTRPVIESLANSGIQTSQKIKALASNMDDCDVDMSVDTDKVIDYMKANGGTMSCPNGLKTQITVYRTSAGLGLAPGECRDPLMYTSAKSLFGWSSGTTVCNFGRFDGKLPYDLRVRFTAHAYVPKSLELASK